MDDYLKIINQLETNRDLINDVVKDLKNAANAMDEYLKLIKDPVKILTSQDLSKELSEISNKISIHTLMATNKINALNEYNASLDKEESDE